MIWLVDTMKRRHRDLLSVNHDFLVNEIPVDQVLEALRPRDILTRHDFDQLRTLRHQGRKALARYLLAVLPQRGSKAFESFLESLQEANAQHLVDLLLQQAGAHTVDDLLQYTDEDYPISTPSDTPLPLGPDPHEYVVRLTRNNKFIRRFVDPAKISPMLAQNKVMTAREVDMVLHLHGKNKKWDLILAVLLQRGERAYQAFMAALLKNDYSTVFHTINETPTGRTDSDNSLPSLSDDDGCGEYDEALNSDEEIKKEVTQLQEKSAARDKMEDNNESKADDTMLKMSNDLVGASPDDQSKNMNAKPDEQNETESPRNEVDMSETTADDHEDNLSSPQKANNKNGGLENSNGHYKARGGTDIHVS